MEKLYGIVKEVYIPLQYKNGNLLDIMDRSVIGFKVLIDDNIDCFEFEQDEFNVRIMKDDEVVITADAKEYNNVKKALTGANLEIELDEVSMVALDKVTLEGEDLELFNKLMNMLDEIEDVQNVYHNVEL